MGATYDTASTIVDLRIGSLTALVLLVGWAVVRRRAQDHRHDLWLHASGLVLDELDVGYGAGDSTSYYPVVTFRTAEGADVRGTPRGGVNLGLQTVGRRVPVWYDPQDPACFEARIHWTDRAGTVALLTAVVPAVLLVVSFLP